MQSQIYIQLYHNNWGEHSYFNVVCCNVNSTPLENFPTESHILNGLNIPLNMVVTNEETHCWGLS